MQILTEIESVAGYIIPFLFVLSIVVFFHEFGHFIVGRWCGVKVDAFSIGFGPEIAAFNDRKGTRWRLGALPLGGYVKFHGDANGTSMTVSEAVSTMPAAERKVSFFAQPVWKRVAIVAAGPIANFILAIVIFTGSLVFVGRDEIFPRIGAVRAGEAADLAGFKAGDIVQSVNGTPITNWTDMQRIIQDSSAVSLTFVVQRAGQDLTLTATPRLEDVPAGLNGRKARVGILGVTASSDPQDEQVRRYGVVDSLKMSVGETFFVVDRTVAFVHDLFTGAQSTDQISGPVGIAQISGEVARFGIDALINLAAYLSISIGLINLLPVPLLDGGHLLYYAVEASRGRPMSERAQEMGFRLGLALVAALMIFATFNDIVHLTRG